MLIPLGPSFRRASSGVAPWPWLNASFLGLPSANFCVVLEVSFLFLLAAQPPAAQPPAAQAPAAQPPAAQPPAAQPPAAQLPAAQPPAAQAPRCKLPWRRLILSRAGPVIKLGVLGHFGFAHRPSRPRLANDMICRQHARKDCCPNRFHSKPAWL